MNNYILEGIIKQAANEAAVRTATLLVKSAKKRKVLQNVAKHVEEAVSNNPLPPDPGFVSRLIASLKGLGSKGADATKNFYNAAKAKGRAAYDWTKAKGIEAYGKGKEWAKAHPKTAFGIGAGTAGLGGGGIGYALGGGDDDEDVLASLGGGGEDDGLDIGQLLNDNKFAIGGGIGGAGLGALMGDSTSSKILGALLGGGAGAGLGYLADQNL